MHRRALLTAFLAGAGLAGCGFQLRQSPKLSFRSIALVGFATRSPLADELRRELAAQVRVVDAPAQAEVVLRATEDARDRTVVASTAAAQVRELHLRLRLHVHAATPAGRELMATAELVQERDLSYIETQALAKEAEEAELWRDMQSDLVAQVMRRLAAIRV
jgi:LPS-assembly lipoprotein